MWCVCASSEGAWELFSSHWNTTAHTDKCLKKAVPSYLPSCQGLAQQHTLIVQICLHQLPPFLTLMSHILEEENGKKTKRYIHMKKGKQVMAERGGKRSISILWRINLSPCCNSFSLKLVLHSALSPKGLIEVLFSPALCRNPLEDSCKPLKLTGLHQHSSSNYKILIVFKTWGKAHLVLHIMVRKRDSPCKYSVTVFVTTCNTNTGHTQRPGCKLLTWILRKTYPVVGRDNFITLTLITFPGTSKPFSYSHHI